MIFVDRTASPEMSCQSMRLQGWVGDGQGHVSGKGWIRDPLFTRLLGQVFPGSLNVFVPGEHRFAPGANYPDPAFLKRVGGFAVRDCTVNAVQAFLIRCEYPGPSYRRGSPIQAPHTMFEIIARSFVPNAEWGKEVALEFDGADAALRVLPV